LTGQHEALPTNSRATGTADFMIHSNGRIMSNNVNVNDLDKVIMANIYQGMKGENGHIAVTVIRFKTLMPSGPVSGKLAQGNISSVDLKGPLNGMQITDLTRLIEDNNAYVNVQTKQHPDGNIRGKTSR
jgi:hypothetical protein